MRRARRELSSALASLSDAGEVDRALDELFTPAELSDVLLRWRLMQLLQDGMPQRAIAEKLGISLCKITRGSRLLKTPSAVVKQLLSHKLEGIENENNC